MKSRLISILFALMLVTLAVPVCAKPMAQDTLRTDLDSIRERVYPALVNISVVMRYFDDGRAQRSPAGGSGVIISPDGYVLTNFHVAGHTTHIVCTLLDGETIDADDIADDPLSDLSVLKLRLGPRTERHEPLHYAVLGDSDSLQVGEFVAAMGNPLMLSSSLTLGVVSNTRRVFTDFTGTEIEDMELDEGEKTGIFTRWIQHDALILPGNSGGPLVNMKGEVVGINELGGDGAGFAIPSNLARQVFSQVILYGHVRRGWLNLQILPVQKLGRTTGALVSSVTPHSNSDLAGIRPGDIILSLDGHPTNVRFFEEVPLFYQQIAAMSAGHHVVVRLLRDGAVRQLVAVVQPMEKFLGEEQEFRGMGATVRDITPSMARERFLNSTAGVIVTGVRPGYPFDAAQPQLAADDIIREVDGHAIQDAATLRHVLDHITGSSFPVAFQRGDEQLITVVKKNTDNSADSGGDLPQAWLGVKTQVLVPEVAKALGEPNTSGFRVTEVLPWTTAAKAGLRSGDIITAVDGNALDASQLQDSEELTHTIEAMSVGEKATLTILRGVKARDISVTLEPTPKAGSDIPTARQTEFEFAVRGITLFDRVDYHWSLDQTGVMVADVTMGGWAHIAGLHIEDLLLSVNGQPVPDVAHFTKVMNAVKKSRPKTIILFVRRKNLTQFVFIEPDWSKLSASE